MPYMRWLFFLNIINKILFFQPYRTSLKKNKQKKTTCGKLMFVTPEDSHCTYQLCSHNLGEATRGAKGCLSSRKVWRAYKETKRVTIKSLKRKKKAKKDEAGRRQKEEEGKRNLQTGNMNRKRDRFGRQFHCQGIRNVLGQNALHLTDSERAQAGSADTQPVF